MEIDTIKISELAEGSQINNDSILVYNLNGQTKKITFQNLKNAVISALASEVSQLDADLSTEALARAEADTALAGDISTEATARTAADTTLSGTIADYKTRNIVEQVAYDSTSTNNWYEATITPAAVAGYTVCGVAGYKCNKSDVYPFVFYFNGSTLRIGIRRINGDLSDTKFTVYFEYYKS